MNRYYRSGIANVLNTSVSLLLFMMFTVCVLLLIGAAADTYSGINKGYEETYGSAATVRYLSNIKAQSPLYLS